MLKSEVKGLSIFCPTQTSFTLCTQFKIKVSEVNAFN